MRNITKKTGKTGKLCVLLAHADMDFYERAAQLLRENSNIELLEAAQDGDKAIALFERYRPELTILDMALRGTDGLTAAARMRGCDGQAMLWLISGFMGAEVQRRCAELEIGQVFRSAVTPEVVCDRVLGWAVGFVQGRCRTDDEQFRRHAEQLLRSFRLRGWTKGMECTLEAICLSRRGNPVLTKSVYQDVAKRLGTRRENIERMIRYTVDQICRRGDPQVLRRCLGEEFADRTGHLTSGQFIDRIEAYLREQEES